MRVIYDGVKAGKGPEDYRADMLSVAEALTARGAGMIIDVNLIMIIYGVDRLFDMGRTCLNVTGDIACSLCVTKWVSKKSNK